LITSALFINTGNNSSAEQPH